MEMNQNLEMLLNALVRPGVDYNLHQMSYAGASFFTNENGKISGLVPSPSFIIEIEDLDIKPEGDFFHYISNTWQQCPYPVPIASVVERLKSQNFIGKVVVPFTTLINHLNKMGDEFKKKCRVILTPNQLFETDKIMRFADENGAKVFRHPKLPKPCVVASDSMIPPALIQAGVPYKCTIAGETDSEYIINVICVYAKVQIGINYSEHGFFPDNMELINKMINIPFNFIMGTNTIEPAENFVMPPIHLDCNLFYDLSRVFGVVNPSLLEIHFGETPNSPVLIRNIKKSDDDTQVNILLGTLNPYYGAQRR